MMNTNTPMQLAWQRWKSCGLPFSRAKFAEQLALAHLHFQLEAGRQAWAARVAGMSPVEYRIEAINNEIAGLPYRPFSVNIADRKAELEAEKAELEAVASLPAIQNREAA